MLIDIKEDYVLKAKHGKSPAIQYSHFINCLARTKGSDVLDVLQISSSTFKRLTKKAFPDISLQGGATYNSFVRDMYSLSLCRICNCLYARSSYKSSICNSCRRINRNKEIDRKYYSNNRDKCLALFHNNYINNKSDYRARSAKRRAALKNAVGPWTNIENIKQIYLHCPEGYHVDHEIPLQNDLVCGLHTEFNLQYLLAKENLSKGNKFIPE